MTSTDTLRPAPLPPTPLLHDNWNYISKKTLDDLDSHDWDLLNSQKSEYIAERHAFEVLRMLKAQENDPAYGYTTNNYQHCLLTATRMLQDNLPEEDVVVGLLHDTGYMICPTNHGEFVAALLRPYISERNHWMLLNHELFQQKHIHLPGAVDSDEREKFRGHPYFEWTETFVARYDQTTFSCEDEVLPIETFEPMVYRLFARNLNITS